MGNITIEHYELLQRIIVVEGYKTTVRTIIIANVSAFAATISALCAVWAIYGEHPAGNFHFVQNQAHNPELVTTTPNIREYLNDEKNPHVSVVTRDPHPALALFAAKKSREAAAKAKADQQVVPPSQKAYVEDLSRLPESERLNAVKALAEEIQSLGIKLSIASTASLPSPTSPAK